MSGAQPVRASQYRALYRMTPVLYRLGDLRLPFAVPLDSLVLWLSYGLVLWAAYRLPPLRWLPLSPVVGVPLAAWALTWATARLDPAGKSPPMYLLGLLAFALRPRHLRAWSPCPRLPRFHRWSVPASGPPQPTVSPPTAPEEFLSKPAPSTGPMEVAEVPASPAWDLAPPSPPAAATSPRVPR